MEIETSEIRCLEYLYCLKKNCQYSPYFFRHFRCGWHSNIPICCMIFFVTFWQVCWLLGHFPLIRKFLGYYPSHKYRNYRYVPCFFCYFMGSCNRVLTCNVNCRRCSH